MISENNVGAIVKKAGITIGLSRDVWKQTKFQNGIVPAKQAMRLVIVQSLEMEET